MAKKRRKGAGKGSAYERSICEYLSLWFSNGEDDNLFWRSSQSGGRATSRAKRGKRGAGQAGDVSAIDEDGRPLMDAVTIEIKKGYASQTFQDLFDKQATAAKQIWEQWIAQAIKSAEINGTVLWWLITKRDRREPLIAFPATFYKRIKCTIAPLAYLRADVRINDEAEELAFVVCHMDDFFELDPEMVLQCCNDWRSKVSKNT